MTGSWHSGELRFFNINHFHREYFFPRYDSNKVCFLHYKASGCGRNALRFLSWDSSISIKFLSRSFQHICTAVSETRLKYDIVQQKGRNIFPYTQSLTCTQQRKCQNSSFLQIEVRRLGGFGLSIGWTWKWFLINGLISFSAWIASTMKLKSGFTFCVIICFFIIPLSFIWAFFKCSCHDSKKCSLYILWFYYIFRNVF